MNGMTDLKIDFAYLIKDCDYSDIFWSNSTLYQVLRLFIRICQICDGTQSRPLNLQENIKQGVLE